MKTKDRVLVFLSSFFWGTIILFFTGSFLGFLIPCLALVYVWIGGRKHV